MDHCEGCGFSYDLDLAEEAGALIISGAAHLAATVESFADPALRPGPTTWSPHEYACHVRDVLLVQRERVLRARRGDTPSFEPMGRDERVDHDGYAEQDPDDVVRQLHDAAAMFAHVLARLDTGDWERRVTYDYPTGMERSLRWVAMHTVHEVRHHHLDVQAHQPAPTTETNEPEPNRNPS
jgi:hypothetical protein